MNLKIAKAALQALRKGTQGNHSAIRLASRWLQASIALEYDRLIRAQVLEGLAGVPAGTWTRSGGQRALLQAQRGLENLGDMNPAWLSQENSGAYAVLSRAVAKALHQEGMQGKLEPDDIINSALTGMRLDPSEQDLRLLPAYELGKGDRGPETIRRGKVNPQQVAASGLAKAMYFRVKDYVKHVRLEQESMTDDEGAQMDAVIDNPEVSSGEFFSDMLFHATDPVSRKVQDLLYDTWAPSAPMTLWLDITRGKINMAGIKQIWINSRLEKSRAEGSYETFKALEQNLENQWDAANIDVTPGRVPKAKTVADIFDMFPQDFSQKHWRPYWDRFIRALWKDTRLRGEVARKMDQAGAEADMLDPSMIDQITRQAHTQSKLSSLYFLRDSLLSLPLFLSRR